MERVSWYWPGSPGIPADDRGLAYGDGLFETIRVTADGPVLLERHRDRLLSGAQALGIPFGGCDYQQWLDEARARSLLEAGETDQIVKLTLTRGSGGRGYRIPDQPQPRLLTSVMSAPPVPRQPVSVRFCRQPVSPAPGRAGFKTLERLDQVLASQELPPECFEGLMADHEGRIVEGTRTNLMLVQGHETVTPPRHHLAVAGTLRDWLVAVLPDQGYTVTEQRLSRLDVQGGGLLLLNSVMGAVPVGQLDSVSLAVTPETLKLAQWIQQQIGLQHLDS